MFGFVTRFPCFMFGFVTKMSKRVDTFFHLNLEKQADRELFERNFSVRDILSAMHLHSNVLKEPGST